MSGQKGMLGKRHEIIQNKSRKLINRESRGTGGIKEREKKRGEKIIQASVQQSKTIFIN